MTEIGLFDAIYSARALRRLKPDPVPEDVITRILDAAIRAPSAGNAQNWIFLVVRDAALRGALGVIYRKASDIAGAMYQARGRPAHMTEAQYQRMMSSGAYLWDHMGEAPVLLIPCQRERPTPPRAALPEAMQGFYECELAYAERIRGASIYPAVQNIILACRARARHLDHHQPHPLRGRGEGAARHSRRDRDLRVDADRLSARQIRSAGAPAGGRSGVRGSLGGGVARDGA